MAPSEARARGETAEKILEIAEGLIQTRGYSAISYHDIAEALGIRKASIHYHFASKEALGIAVIERYAGRFAAALDEIAGDEARSTVSMLDFYVAPYLQFADTPDRVCLCGGLAGEFMALPAEMRRRVETFFKSHQAWLARLLERGQRRGEFTLDSPPAKMARLIFGALQGALIVKRTTGDVTQLRDVVQILRSQLSRPEAKPAGPKRQAGAPARR